MLGEDYGPETFARSESTFTYAALRSDPLGPLVRLAPGTAEERRAFTRSQLMCPFPGCPTPALTTVNRSAQGYRDGYRHLSLARGHSDEGFFHLLGKAAIVHWAMKHPAVADARTEVTLGPRRADVVLTGRHGHRIAVEIQYAALSIDEWRERSDSYRAQGVTPVWLWGHCGELAPDRKEVTRPREVQRRVMSSGQPLLWINPTDETLALALARGGHLPGASDTHVSLQFAPLDQSIKITPTGLYPPGWELGAAHTRLREQARRHAIAQRALVEQTQRERATTKRARQREQERVDAETSYQYWERIMPMRPGEMCDVCKHPVLPGQARKGRRHDVCAYLL